MAKKRGSFPETMTKNHIDILIIEDDLDDITFIQNLLDENTDFNIRFKHATSLGEGLEAIRNGQFDLILLDFFLPKNSGLESLVKTKYEAGRTPVVLLTNIENENTAREAMQHGAQNYIHKPFKDVSLFIRIITNAIQRGLTDRALQTSTERYQTLFDSSPISIWEEDFSQIKLFLASLKDRGVTNFEGHFDKHPEDLEKCAELLIILDVNKTTLKINQAPDKETLLKQITPKLTQETRAAFKNQILALVSGENTYSENLSYKNPDGHTYHEQMHLSLVVGHEHDWSRVIFTFTDITDRIRHQNEMNAIITVSEALRDTAVLEEMLPIILDQLTNILDTTGAAITLRNPVTKENDIALSIGVWEYMTGIVIQPGEGITARIIETNEPYLNNHARTETDPRDLHPESIKLADAVAAVPLNTQNTIIGTLWVARDSTITDEDLNILRAISNIAASAIQRTTLLQTTQNYAAEMERLFRASETLLADTTSSLPKLASNIVQAVLNEFGQSNCSLILIEEGKNQITRIAAGGPYKEEVVKGSLSLNGPGLVPKAIVTQQIINIPDVTTDPDYLPHWKEARSEIAIPLKIGNRVIGALDVQSAHKNAFTPDDERMMSIFAERAALALENNRLFDEAQRRHNFVLALRDIDNAITSSLDLNLTLNVFLTSVINLMGVDAASVLLLDKTQNLVYKAGRGFHTNDIKESNLPLGKNLAGQVALERNPIELVELKRTAVSPAFKQFTLLENFIQYAAYPLIAKGNVQGVLEIFNRTPLNPSEEWYNFLKSLANQAAIAIHNAELFEEQQTSKTELEVAYAATLEGWVRALDMRDQETEGHTMRVTNLTIKLAIKMGFQSEELIHIRRGALLHDIGKMGIPDNILHKAGPLTPEEREIIELHSTYARNFLSRIDYLKPALDIPYSHHEKWNGTGYPQGLKGEQIPRTARIFAIVDVWDALNSDRPYRKAWPEEKIVEYIKAESGSHFDPKIVTTFLELINEENLRAA